MAVDNEYFGHVEDEAPGPTLDTTSATTIYALLIYSAVKKPPNKFVTVLNYNNVLARKKKHFKAMVQSKMD